MTIHLSTAIPSRFAPIKYGSGAGDALLAGIAWALVRESPVEEIARWGIASGTAAAARAGVSVGTRAEVEALYEQVQIDQL